MKRHLVGGRHFNGYEWSFMEACTGKLGYARFMTYYPQFVDCEACKKTKLHFNALVLLDNTDSLYFNEFLKMIEPNEL